MNKMTTAQSLALDAIRAFAAQIVVIGHALSFFGIRKLPVIQKSGVIIFFILSGMVISYSVIHKDRNTYRFKDFFIARFARIYSGLVPCLLVIFCLDWVQTQWFAPFRYADMLNVKTFVGNLFMLQNYQDTFWADKVIPAALHIEPFGSGRPLWTLAIEWWIYMAFGYLFCAAKKSVWIYGCGAVLMIIPLWHLVAGSGNGLTFYWLEGFALTYVIFSRNVRIRIGKKALLGACSGFILLSLMRLAYVKTPYDLMFATFCALLIAVIVLYLQEHAVENAALKSVVTLTAAYSYTLYLTHYSVMSVMAHFNHALNKYYLFVLGIALSNLLALAIARYTEMRHRQFGALLRRTCGLPERV